MDSKLPYYDELNTLTTAFVVSHLVCISLPVLERFVPLNSALYHLPSQLQIKCIEIYLVVGTTKENIKKKKKKD